MKQEYAKFIGKPVVVYDESIQVWRPGTLIQLSGANPMKYPTGMVGVTSFVGGGESQWIDLADIIFCEDHRDAGDLAALKNGVTFNLAGRPVVFADPASGKYVAGIITAHKFSSKMIHRSGVIVQVSLMKKKNVWRGWYDLSTMRICSSNSEALRFVEAMNELEKKAQ